jgi:hypothetical protein
MSTLQISGQCILLKVDQIEGRPFHYEAIAVFPEREKEMKLYFFTRIDVPYNSVAFVRGKTNGEEIQALQFSLIEENPSEDIFMKVMSSIPTEIHGIGIVDNVSPSLFTVSAHGQEYLNHSSMKFEVTLVMDGPRWASTRFPSLGNKIAFSGQLNGFESNLKVTLDSLTFLSGSNSCSSSGSNASPNYSALEKIRKRIHSTSFADDDPVSKKQKKSK